MVEIGCITGTEISRFVLKQPSTDLLCLGEGKAVPGLWLMSESRGSVEWWTGVYIYFWLLSALLTKIVFPTMPASSASSSSESGSASSSRASSPKATPDTTHSSRKNRPGADGARNEGINPHWAFKPPAGTVALDHDEDFAEYDWDAVNDEDVELWLVRAPADVRSAASRLLKSTT